MSITITSVNFQDEYTGANLSTIYAHDIGTSVFMGSVGDKMFALITGYVSWGTSNVPLKFNSSNNTIERIDCSGGSFIDDELKVGDSIQVVGSAANDGLYTILLVSDTLITTNEHIANTETDASVSIHGVTPIESFDLYYNVCSQQEQSLVSLSDTVTQKLSTDSNFDLRTGPGSVNLFPATKSTAWTDDVQSFLKTSNLNGSYQRPINIYVTFYIKPFFLSGQTSELNNLLLGAPIQAPAYFQDDTCLSFLYQVDAKFKRINATANHTSGQQFIPGNVGWFNEFLNTDEVYDSAPYYVPGADWQMVSIVYTDSVTGLVQPSFDYNKITTVTVVLRNQGIDLAYTPNAFTAAPYVLNWMWLPNDPSSYQNQRSVVMEPGAPFPLVTPTGLNLINHRYAFRHDRAFSTVGASVTDGDRFGSPLQVLTDITAVVTSTNEATFTFNIEPGSLVQSALSQGNLDYMIWITPQTSASAASHLRAVQSLEETDRNAVLVDVNTAFTNTDDATLIVDFDQPRTDVLFYKYPDTSLFPYSDFKGSLGEYGLARSVFNVKHGCIIENVNVSIEVDVYHGGNQINSFDLETWNNQTADFYSGTFNQISINQTRGFDLPLGSLYNTRSINNAEQYSTGTSNGFEIVYGFQIGYQFWQSLVNFDPQFQNYRTQYWPAYTQGRVWTATGLGPRIPAEGYYGKIRMKFLWNVQDTNTGVTTQFIKYCDISAYDAVNNLTRGITTTFDTQDNLAFSLGGVFASDIQTVTVNTFTTQNYDLSLSGGIFGTLMLYYQNGLQNVVDTITTLDLAPESPTSLWVAPPTIFVQANSLTPPITYTITITGLLDLTLAPFPVNNINLYASYDFVINKDIVTDDGQNITTDTGTNITTD